MLAIRMQRVGRKGHAQFRVIVQDSHRSPAAGKIVEYLGSYNPHTKEAKLDKENIEKYLSNGAQPSNRVAILLEKEGYKLPEWVEIDKSGKRTTKNTEKLRKDQPKKKPAPKEEVKPEAESAEVVEEAPAEEEPAKKAEEKTEEKPAEESPAQPKEEKIEPKETKDDAPAKKEAEKPK